jgi:hypothetical protein
MAIDRSTETEEAAGSGAWLRRDLIPEFEAVAGP